jgi:hypothetical protein
MNLTQASNQWATRPDDERFWTLADLYAACRRHREQAREALAPLNALRLQAGSDGASLALVGPTGNPASLTHWSFGQVSRSVGAPADYLRRLPAPMAAANLNYGLEHAASDRTANLLIQQNGGLTVRAATSDQYSRIWNMDVVSRLQDFERFGWQVPPARPAPNSTGNTRIATEADCLEISRRNGGGGLTIKPGDTIGPAGLYASDRDLFIFLVNESKLIQDGTDGGLARGFFARNTEVGDGALSVWSFLYRSICGNHIIWGAKELQKIRIVHRGDADARFARELTAEVTRYAESSATEEEARILQAQKFTLGTDKETVLDAVFTALRGDLTRKALDAGYETAALTSDTDRTIDPRTAWGLTQGLTQYSQTLPYQGERDKLDRAAGKVLAMAF